MSNVLPPGSRCAHVWPVSVLTSTIIVAQQLYMGRAVTGLSVALGVAFTIWVFRLPQPGWKPGRVLVVFLVGVGVQLVHFLEELLTNFSYEFPALLGYEWTNRQFVVFNACWLAAFVSAAWGVHRRWAEALLIVWFFATVAISNGVLHVSVALWQGGYFPGVVTAPVLFGIGVVLFRRLVEITTAGQRPGGSPGAGNKAHVATLAASRSPRPTRGSGRVRR